MAPLIARLSTNVQGRVLQSAALVLEKSNKLWQQSAQTGEAPHRQKDSEKENRSVALAASHCMIPIICDHNIFINLCRIIF